MNDTDDPITPPELYLNRRAIMRSGAVAASAATTALMYRWFNPATKVVNDSAPLANLKPSSEISDPTLRAGWETSEEKHLNRMSLATTIFTSSQQIKDVLLQWLRIFEPRDGKSPLMD